MPNIDSPNSTLVPRLQGLHLFHFDPAPCAQRVRFALAEKGLNRGREVRWDSDAPASLLAPPGTWVSRHVSLIRKDHLTETYAAIHPHMVVPALVHDGRLYIESMDIVKYLDECWPQNRLIPQHAAERELAESLVEQGKKLHVSVRYVSFRWGLGRLGKLGAQEENALRSLERENSPEQLLDFYTRYNRDAIDQETFDTHLRALQEAYRSLEDILNSDRRTFLVGKDFSIADIIWSCNLLRITECGYPFRRDFPALSEWYARVSRRPAFQDGVMSKHRTMSKAFELKAWIENLFGRGLRQHSLRILPTAN